MTEPSLSGNSDLVLRTHAKSFAWAGMFLPARNLSASAELYHFCRYVDDVADELAPDVARVQLEVLKSTLAHQEKTQLLLKAGVRTLWMQELIRGVESDLDEVRLATSAELLVYCYRVAGVVGLMMCPLIGIKDNKAYPFAIDLGIAMQLTNIARDVAEDALRGRVYLPGEWCRAHGVTQEQVLTGQLSAAEKQALVGQLLALADTYYASGRWGFHYIPWRTRIAMGVAARLYHAIGGRLRKQDLDPWRGRAATYRLQKVMLSLSELMTQVCFLFVGHKKQVHARALHEALVGLPGVDE